MTRNEAIAELVRIWHSPHLDLSLKASLGEVIETLKEKNQSNFLVRDEADDCKESESKLDLISRQDAIEALLKAFSDSETVRVESGAYWHHGTVLSILKSLPSAEPKTGEWIKATGMMPPEFHGHHCCSECGDFANMGAPLGNREDLSRYCPNCGAKMYKGGEDE